MKKKFLVVIYISLFIFIVFSNVSYGYLDPSAMTYFIQILSAIDIGLTTFIGVLVYKFKKIFFGKKKKDKNIKMNIDDVLNESKEENKK